MKKVVQKTFQITTEIRENPFNKAQHDQSAKGRGRKREEQVSLQADADVDDDDAADYDGALNRHRPTSAVSRYPHHVQPPPSPR